MYLYAYICIKCECCSVTISLMKHEAQVCKSRDGVMGPQQTHTVHVKYLKINILQHTALQFFLLLRTLSLHARLPYTQTNFKNYFF